MSSLTEREYLQEMFNAYQQGVGDAFTAIFDALLSCPDSLTAPQAGVSFKETQPAMEAQLVAAFDQALAEMMDGRR